MVGWAGVRAATLGMIPGAQLFRVTPSAAKAVPVMATQFPEIAPIEPPPAVFPNGTRFMGYGGAVRPIIIPIDYPRVAAPPPPAQQAVWNLPEPRRQFYSPTDRADNWQASRLVSGAMPAQSRVTEPMQSTAPAVVAERLDRIQLTMWAMLRGQQQVVGSTSLASAGQIGGSQAGARLFYNFTPGIAAVLRSSSQVNRQGGEVAAGIRLHPLRSVPVWINAERRIQLGRYGGGRDAFAVFVEGGIYDRPMPWEFTLDGYLQAGMVGLQSRDLFADGGVTFTRPAYRQFSAGLGVWGGVQPGLYRIDAGPRVTMKVRRNVRVHVDWRQRVAGNAQPGSGPVLTLAGDF